MKPAKFDYAKAADAADAVAKLGASDDFIKPIAGGMSLGPMMNLRLAQPDALVDVGGLTDLRKIEDRGDSVFIGAAVTHAMIEDGAVPEPSNGMLRFVAGQIAYRAVRNRGTVGGSIAHADPAADWPTALRVLGAEAVVAGPGGEKSVPLADFQIGPFTVALEPDEIVAGLSIPKLSPDAKWGYYKVCRKPGEFADSLGTVVIDEALGNFRAVLGANDGAPADLDAVAEKLRGGATSVSIDEVKAVLADAGMAFDEYHEQIHAVSISRAVKEAFAR